MKSIGNAMKKNIKYKEGKELMERYVTKTERYVESLQWMCDKYACTDFDLPEFAGFDYGKAIRYMRTWKIIQELPVDKRNLWLVYLACETDYTKTLEVYNGVGQTCKNIATLRVMVSNVRKLIRSKYTERYGSD